MRGAEQVAGEGLSCKIFPRLTKGANSALRSAQGKKAAATKAGLLETGRGEGDNGDTGFGVI
jgi:hypothetical protein